MFISRKALSLVELDHLCGIENTVLSIWSERNFPAFCKEVTNVTMFSVQPRS